VSHAPVRVEVRRSGGFAGRVTDHVADTAALDPAEADELRRLIAALEATDPASTARSRGADRFQYDVTVHRGARRRRYTADDGALTSELRGLVEFVQGTAREARRADHPEQ
jgi:hypothetical protein